MVELQPVRFESDARRRPARAAASSPLVAAMWKFNACISGCCAALSAPEDEASVEYFPEGLEPIARQLWVAVKDAVAARSTQGDMQGIWRTVSMHGHSTVECPQDLDGPCSDLRTDEVWVAVPAEFLDSKARYPSLQAKMQLTDQDSLIVWRALRMGSRWRVRYAGGPILPGQAGEVMRFQAEMCERELPAQDQSTVAALAESAAAAVSRYHAVCCTMADEAAAWRGGA